MQKKFIIAMLLLSSAALSMRFLADEALSQAQKPEVTGKSWMAADTNGDGKISKEEYMELNRKRAEAAFNAMDANHDGEITPDELASYYEKRDAFAKEQAAKQTPAPAQKPQ